MSKIVIKTIILCMFILLISISVNATGSCADVETSQTDMRIDVDDWKLGSMKSVPLALRPEQDTYFGFAAMDAFKQYDNFFQLMANNAQARANVYCTIANPSVSCIADRNYGTYTTTCHVSNKGGVTDTNIEVDANVVINQDIVSGLTMSCSGDVKVPDTTPYGALRSSNPYRITHGLGSDAKDDYFVYLKDFKIKATIPSKIVCIKK